VNAKAVQFPQGTRNNKRGRSNDRSSPYNRERSKSPYKRDSQNSNPYRQDHPLNRYLSRECSSSIDRSSRDRLISKERPHHINRSQNRRYTDGNYHNPKIHHYQTPSPSQPNLRNSPNQFNCNSPSPGRPTNLTQQHFFLPDLTQRTLQTSTIAFPVIGDTVGCFLCGLRGHIRT
jgi:hypothetical protein